jgi:methylmalonyl-CoA mutase N-terminal domain/subunit
MSKPDGVPDRPCSPAEQEWTATTLAAALSRNPERPIGADSGGNRDAAGNARFTSISGTPVRRLYTAADLPDGFDPGVPGVPPYTVGHVPGHG